MTTNCSNPRYGSEPTICIPPIVGKSGAASLVALTPLDLFRSTVGRYGTSPAMAVQRPSLTVREKPMLLLIMSGRIQSP
jgi:hypothetical protein